MFPRFLEAEIPLVSAQSLASIFYSQFDFYRFHSLSFFRGGPLQKDANALWIDEGFGSLQYEESKYLAPTTTLYNHLMLGSDTSFVLNKISLYLGGTLSLVNANSQSQLFQGKKESYALGGYFSYFRQDGLFVNLGVRYFYKTQTLFFKESSLNHSIYGNGGSGVHLGVQVGQRFPIFSIFDVGNFFLEPSMMIQTGYLSGEKFTLRDNLNTQSIDGEMRGFFPLTSRLSLAFGKEWDSRGSLKGGFAMEYDTKINGIITLKEGNDSLIYLKERDDFRLDVFVEVDFKLNERFKFFARSHHLFFGKFGSAFGVNLGVRLGFGALLKHGLHSKKSIDWTDERLQ